MKKTTFLIPYYGEKPPFFEVWLRTAVENRNYLFCFISDINLPVKSIANVTQIRMSFKDMQNLIANKIPDANLCLEPYKLCDYKPALGFLFEDVLADSDYWGWLDIDLVLGNLDYFLRPLLEEGVDKVNFQGHFTVFRNSYNNNRLFLK